MEAFRALGRALLEVLGAEWKVLAAEWKRSGRWFLISLGLFFFAACCLLVLIALVVYAAVQLLALWLPVWGAALVVAAAVGLVIALAVGAGYLILKRGVENPVTTARRRVEDHLDWWDDRLLREERALPEGDADEDSDAGAE
ncbi:MAG: hypothetical protein GY856_27955 [bacterium]|nr:hypothetical protein [bacterium]